MDNSEFKVIDLNLNEQNESSIIKFKDYKFILKTTGIGTYGTDRIASLFVMLPSGEKSLVQKICFVRFVTNNKNSDSFNSLCIEHDCYIRGVSIWEGAVEHAKDFIKILYGD